MRTGIPLRYPPIPSLAITPAGRAGPRAADLKHTLAATGPAKWNILYLDFGTITSSTFNFLNSTPLALSLQTRVVDHAARAGMSYKFD